MFFLAKLKKKKKKIRNDQGQTPLYWACESDDPFLVQVLIENGADVNAAESFGFTPLHLAAYLGHSSITKVLVTAGASLVGTNNDGSTPLHLAAKQNHVDVVRILVSSPKADLLAKDGSGFTPIQLCEKGSESFDVLRDKLLEMKRERDGSTPAGGSGSTSTGSLVGGGGGASSAGGSTGALDAVGKEQIEKMQKAIVLLTSNIEVERGRVSELERRLAEEMARSNDLLKRGGLSLCVKCHKKIRDRVLLPCMHLYYCGDCAKSMSICESCNTPICGKVPAKLE